MTKSATSPSTISRLAHSEISRCISSTVDLTIRLGAWPLNGRALATIEKPELDPGPIGHTPHHTVERIDLADQMPLAKTANGRIAGHDTDRRARERDQSRPRAHPRGGVRGFGAGVASTNHATSYCFT